MNHPDNEDRANWAQKSLALFSDLTGEDNPQEAISDLICDLHHLADREEVDWDLAMRCADGNYQDEAKGLES